MDNHPTRKNIRLSPSNYLGYHRYFITLCTFHRRKHFTNPAKNSQLLALLKTESATSNFAILAYCLMPDHLHFLAEALTPNSDLLHLLKSFKLKSSRHFFDDPADVLWQKGFYDQILRPHDVLESVIWYIWLNPVRKQLAITPQDYPYAGSFTGLKMPKSWTNKTWTPAPKQSL